MHKKIALTTLMFAIIAPTSIAFANDNQQSATNDRESQREQTKRTTEANREQNKQNIENQREANKQGLNEQREANKEGIKTLRQEKRLEFQDKKEKMVEEKCKNIETKIANRIGRYENNGKMLQTVYGNMQARLARLVSRLDEKGADTTKLKTDLQTLNEKITKLHSDQVTFMTTLKDSQTFVCGKSEGEFKGKLEQARKVPEIIKQDREDIKTFFQTTIKADLKVIRALLADQKEASETPEAPKVAPVTEVTPTPIQ